jgi:hypothetical protein
LFALAAAQGQTARPPSASEVFHMRTECAKLGDQLMKDESRESVSNHPPTSKENRSHYDPRSNRCYVELREWSLTDREDDRLLYDGQTREMLAYTFDSAVYPECCRKGGVILMKSWEEFTASLGLKPQDKSHYPTFDFRFVRDLIDAAMAEDRTQ